MNVVVPGSGPHGGDARAVALALGLDPAEMLDLSVSTNPFAPDVRPILAAAVEAGALGRYPDDLDTARATAALAERLEVDPSRVLITNGGSEAIALVAAEVGSGRVDEPDFSLYGRHLRSLSAEGRRFRSDPHNPTGLLAADTERSDVWDEAFYALATGRWTRGPGPDPRSAPAILIGSLTKLFGCPGLRLGYVVAPDDDGEALGLPGLVGRLRRRQPRWAVGTAALVAVPTLLDRAEPHVWAARIAEHRTQLVGLLRSHGLSPRRSDANFVLVDGDPDLRARLAPLGVVVRDCASFGLPGCARVAVPDEEGLERIDRALRTLDRPWRAGAAVGIVATEGAHA